MAFSLVWWELYALFAPDQIKIDIYDLLCSRGGALFQSYCTPCGLHVTERKEFRRKFMTERRGRNTKLFATEEISDAYKRFRQYFYVAPR